MMKKIFLFCAVIIMISGCGAVPEMQDMAQNAKTMARENAHDVAGSVEACVSGCAVMTGEGIFSRETCEGSCWADEAKQKKDVTICDEMIMKENSIPKMACYIGIAEETGDPIHCNKIADDQKDLMVSSCYATVADKYNDPALCDGIKGTIMYDPCVADANSTN